MYSCMALSRGSRVNNRRETDSSGSHYKNKWELYIIYMYVYI